jgi:hypothetical protein
MGGKLTAEKEATRRKTPNTKHQAPKKLQASSPEHQRSIKLQIPRRVARASGSPVDFLGVWHLELP